MISQGPVQLWPDISVFNNIYHLNADDDAVIPAKSSFR